MTTARPKIDALPLFAWSGGSGSFPKEKDPEIPGARDLSNSLGNEPVPTPNGPEDPACPGPKVPIGPEAPDFLPEFVNDSDRSREAIFYPYGGTSSGPTSPLDPISSLEAAGIGGPQRDGRRPELRPYQTGSITGVEAEWDRGVRRTLVVLPTGTGKTVVMAELARRLVARGRRVLVLAHRTELLEQAHRKLGDAGVLAGIEQADRKAGHAPVVVASVQTLRGPRLKRLRAAEFDVMIDEAHHATATSYRAILEHFSGSNVLGVTATPDRADGTALGEIFDSVAYRYELRQAIDDKFLAPIKARRIFLEGVDLSSVKSRAGDLAQDELAAILGTEEAVHGVVGPLLEQTVGKRTILFAVNVAHARAIAEVINRHRPDAARAVDGSSPDEVRKAALRDFAGGRFQYLINCALFTEGFDEPSIEVVATARPTKSRALCMQMVGRGTRKHPGKVECLWLDFTGNAGRHKLIGPVDALAAGPVDDEQRREAERHLDEEGGDVDAALERAEQELEERRRRAKVTASARYFATEVDPFFGDEIGPPCTEPWAGEPATEEQRRDLLALGMKKLATSPTCTRGEAVRVLGAEERRKKLGLCSYKQARILQRTLGAKTVDMSRRDAGARMQILFDAKWDLAIARPRLQKLEADELLRKASK